MDEILNFIGSVSEDFPSFQNFQVRRKIAFVPGAVISRDAYSCLYLLSREVSITKGEGVVFVLYFSLYLVK